MAVPGSGQLRLRGDIALEVDGSATGSDVSLRTLSSTAGFSTPDSMSDFYGYSAYTAPTVQTWAASGVTGTSMTINGFFQRASVESPGITQRGFYFGTNPNMTSNPRYTNVTWPGGNGFYMNRTGLSSSTTYYIWAFVVDSEQETVGSRISQITNAAFIPQYANYSTGASTGYRYRMTGVLTFAFQYYNPDTGSYVQYGSLYRTDTNNSTFASSSWTRSGIWNQHCINSRNNRYGLISGIVASQGSAPRGFANLVHTSDYPNRYMTSRSLSGAAPGFSPTPALRATSNYPGTFEWIHNTETSSTWPNTSMYHNYYFNYTTNAA